MTSDELLAATDLTITLLNRLLTAVGEAKNRGEITSQQQSERIAKIGVIRGRVGLPRVAEPAPQAPTTAPASADADPDAEWRKRNQIPRES